jgi:GT2 family glycosyltransferase
VIDAEARQSKVIELPLEGDLPLAARLMAAADEVRGGVVIIGGAAGLGRQVARLLHGPYGITAVVPQRGTPAGAFHRGVRDLARPEEQGSDGGGRIAVTGGVIARAGLDPGDDDPGSVAARLTAAADDRGRVVSHPLWAHDEGGGSSPRPGDQGDEDPIRMLVVTGPLWSERVRQEDRATAELIRSLAEIVGASRLTVMITERADPSLRQIWQAAGIDVVEGPEAWQVEGEPDFPLYSHIFVTAAGCRSSVRAWIERVQPHATRILFFPSVPSRDPARISPISPPDEMEGLEDVRRQAEGADVDLLRWAHAAWCQWPQDASLLGGWVPGLPVTDIPPAVRVGPGGPGPRGREGVVLVAGEPHDVLGGHEDAALRALREVIPCLRRRDPSLTCTVIADRPSSVLEQECRSADAVIVPEADMGAAIASARVLLAAHDYGAGQPAVLMAALEGGLPFVATRHARAEMEVPAAGPADTAEDQVSRVWRLISDDARWTATRNEMVCAASARYDPDRRHDVLIDALASLGLTGSAGGPAWPAPAIVEPWRRPFANPRLTIRPAGSEVPPLERAGLPSESRARYRLWNEFHGPNREVLAAISSEVAALAYQPVISVLMPVFNTDPEVLRHAVLSVTSQVYPGWQLCIANDGSDRPETLRVLDEFRHVSGITVVDQPAPSGIAAATNAALDAATGEFVTFLDHDDELKPHALGQVARWLNADPTIDVLYTDEDKLGPTGELYEPHIKPDWSPDQLTAQNYLCHLTVARRDLVEKVGRLRSEYDGSQDYDLILRLTEATDRIAHIPEPLYSWRAVQGSAAAVVDAKPFAILAARRAVSAALQRRGYGTRVDTNPGIGWRARYPVPGQPKVSIIVPTKNGRPLLERCLESVLDKSTYRNYEIVVIDNQSSDGPTLEYLATSRFRVVRYPHRFNYARMMNLAARLVDGDALLFLNNDTEVISPDWIEGLLEHAMRPEVGAVGGRLYLENGTPQHEGIRVGIVGNAYNVNHVGFWSRGDLTRNVTAVTGACTMVRPSVYWRVGGNDERLRVAYNDVDLCLRIRQAGYHNVYAPHVELYHHESSTRGKFEHAEDGPFFATRWKVGGFIDPYYSPMFEDIPPFQVKL